MVTVNTEVGNFWQQFSPSLSVRTRIGTSRRAIILLGADITHSLDNPAGTYDWRWGGMSISVIDLKTGLETVGPGNTATVGNSLGGNTGVVSIPYIPGESNIGNVFMINEPSWFPTAPGEYEFTIWHAANFGNVDFSARTLVVIPY